MLAKSLMFAILKPYLEAYHRELTEGKEHKENVEITVDFYFSDIFVSFKVFLNVEDEEKDRELRAAKQHLSAIKQAVFNVLVNNKIVIILKYIYC